MKTLAISCMMVGFALSVTARVAEAQGVDANNLIIRFRENGQPLQGLDSRSVRVQVTDREHDRTLSIDWGIQQDGVMVSGIPPGTYRIRIDIDANPVNGVGESGDFILVIPDVTVLSNVKNTILVKEVHRIPIDVKCFPDLPDPQLELVESGREYADYQGTKYVNYQFRVANWKKFPAELFAAAPDLPPCGQNPNASRTWTDTYDAEWGIRLYGSCGAIEDFKGLYARVPVKKGDDPPKAVFLTLQDRKCSITYKSNTVELSEVEAFNKSAAQKNQKPTPPIPTKPLPIVVQKQSPAPVATNSAKQVIKLRNGNLLEGTITRQNDKEVTIDVPQAGQVTFTRSEIASIKTLHDGSAKPASPQANNVSGEQAQFPNSAPLIGHGDEPLAILKIAEEALAKKDYQTALTAFDRVEAGKGTLEVDIMDSPIRSAALQQALTILEHEVQSKPDDASLHFYLGRIYRFIGIMTPIVTSHRNGSSTTVGGEERKLYLTKAAEQFRSVRTLEPSRHEAAYYLAKTYSLLSQFEEALASVQDAVKSAPGRIDYQDYQAGLYLTTGRFTEAAAAYEALLKEPIAGRKEVEFALEKLKLLNQLTTSEAGEQKPEVPDQFEGTAVLKFMDARLDVGSFAGRKPEELAAVQQQMKDGLSKEEWNLSMQQDGHVLNAMDVQGVYSGFTTGNAFVLGSQQSGEEEGCQIIQRAIITGQLKHDGTLRVINGMRRIVDHPENCPKALGSADTIWEGTLRKAETDTEHTLTHTTP